jgi:putative radical SAM enzyme (TIGR03279 family)
VRKCIKSAIVAEVEEGSIAAELGLEQGDAIIAVNRRPLADLIQFQFEWSGEEVLLEIQKKSGERALFEIEKDYDEPLGAVFAQAVFDGIKVCRNQCLFCFVDQMPKGLRKTLYIKDDDYRLSFLQGSYITLTNLTEHDLQRIIEERLSPLYISVHTTVPELRVKLLGHPQAGQIVEQLTQLSRQGISFHTQIVLCPGINDGAALETTYRDLAKMEGVLSIALVPVGLTAHRQGLPVLARWQREEAGRIIDWAEEKQQEAKKVKGTHFLWPADEFYLAAGRDLPAYRKYEDFPQLENGVGLVRLFWREFSGIALPGKLTQPAKYICVTGESGAYALKPALKKLNAVGGLSVELKVVPNRFFGPSVTVTGLLTGTCLLNGLKDIPEDCRVLLPAVMLRETEDTFLDGLTLTDVEKKLGYGLAVIPALAQSLVNAVLDDTGGKK